MHRFLAAGLVVLGLAGLPASAADETWVAVCAAEAASPWEAGYETIGKGQYEMNIEAAVAACERAFATQPSLEVRAWLARAYVLAGNAAEGRRHAESAALGGNLLGLHIAGSLLTESETPGDAARGQGFLEDAAEAGFVPSINTIGYNYENGIGVAADGARALEYYRRAAALNYDVSQTNIGFFYRDGIAGTEQDYEQSVEWFRKGAAGGDPNAMDALGYAYEWGLGVEQDLVESTSWYAVAAARGFSWSIANLAYAYHAGKGVERDDERALELFQQAYDGGTTWAGSYIAKMYVEGLGGVARDLERARPLIEEGLADDDYTAMYLMGRIYEDGLGVDKNLATARDWYEKAIAAGDEEDAPAALERVTKAAD